MPHIINDIGTTNYYELLPQKYLGTGINYPNKKLINVNLPARIGVIGASGSCKTNWLLNFIELVDNWDTVTLIAKNTQEPLYIYLVDCLKKAKLPHYVFNTLENLKPCQSYDAKKNNLIIIDDFVNASAKELITVGDYFTMGRKNGITCCILSQSYYKIPQLIRQNLNYLVIFKISTKNDLSRVISDNSLDIDIDTALSLLRYVRSKSKQSFMLIDKDTDQTDLKFRINFNRTDIKCF